MLPNIVKHSSHFISDIVNREAAAARSIILKQPDPCNPIQDKGVLLITFTATLSYYYYHVNLNELMKHYHIVLEPSWAGYCDPQILFFCQYRDPVIVQSTERLDRDFLDTIDTNLKAVDFGASDWVDHAAFKPIDECQKKYDSVYVANYNSIKRIEVYLRALRKIKETGKSFNAALVCAKWGKERDYYLKLIDKYRLNEMLDRFEGLDKTALNLILNQSKVNILLSLKEGSNRSLFESMFSGTPVIALKNNIGINKDYINDETGKLIDENDLAETLLYFQKHFGDYDARTWALKNISPEATTLKLKNAIAKFNNISPEDVPLAIKTNNPEVNYYHESPRDKLSSNLELLDVFDNKNFNSDKLTRYLSKLN